MNIQDKCRKIIELAKDAEDVSWQTNEKYKDNVQRLEHQARIIAPEIAESLLRCIEVLEWYGDGDHWRSKTTAGLSHRWAEGDQGQRARDVLKRLK